MALINVGRPSQSAGSESHLATASSRVQLIPAAIRRLGEPSVFALSTYARLVFCAHETERDFMYSSYYFLFIGISRLMCTIVRS
jgi:hypothetical protein